MAASLVHILVDSPILTLFSRDRRGIPLDGQPGSPGGARFDFFESFQLLRTGCFQLVRDLLFLFSNYCMHRADLTSYCEVHQPDCVSEEDLSGDRIVAKLTTAPGNNAPIGGLKVTTAMGWFAARPSGTESVYKIYAESFRDEDHLSRILSEARQIVNQALDHSGEQP
jgi:hypothetical protein